MKKFCILSFIFLAGCGSTYDFNMKSIINNGNNKTICITSLDKKVETLQYKAFFTDWLAANGFKVVDNKKCNFLFGFGSKLDSFSFNQTVADYGVTGIKSVDTYTNSNTIGSLSGQSQYWGNGYSTFDALGNYNTKSYSHSNVNYNYGITGYHQETVNRYYTEFRCFIMDIKGENVIFSSGVTLNKIQPEEEFIKRVFSIYGQNKLQNLGSQEYFCDDERCTIRTGWDMWREEF